MSTGSWDRVQELVEKALALPDSERTAFVESACAAEAELRDEVLSLLGAAAVEELPTLWLGGFGAPETTRFVPGDRVADRYVIQRLLGTGGMGEVYEARDDDLAISVALKTVRVAGRGDEAFQQLKLEGLLTRAVWHPNVCRMYDLGRHGEGDASVWFLTMEILHGVTLAERLRETGRLTLDRALSLAGQMAAGLSAAHLAGVVHRDFKPANVMLVIRDGIEEAVVTDFGIARASGVGLNAGSDGEPEPVIGTPAYMAPEQISGAEVGPAADIYALGVTLYEMVTGTRPFAGDSPLVMGFRRLGQDPPSPRSIVPDLDPLWDTVILRCLSRDPGRRFQRAEDVVDALLNRTPAAAEETSLELQGRHTLPGERDLFVGRRLEVEALERALAGGARLVTLLGAGGMGKTRLAVHYGWLNLGRWPGGVWFCDLTEARNRNGIAAGVAGPLGVQLGRGDPIEQLGHVIAGRGRCLLILDNFEQVADHAAETVGRWLSKAPEARCVVTSRERLGMDGEQVLTIEPLSIEAGVELFAARASGLRPAFELAGAEAEAAREIVRLVDGMPLAIELAAARIRVMSAAQIVERMRERFRLLTGGRSVHHETLEGAIDGSWDLLTPWERSAWAQLSVFEGGLTLDAAEAVLDLSAWPEAPWVVDILQTLVDKCLLKIAFSERRSGTSEPRFGMYVTLQEYARMKLHSEGGNARRAAEEHHGTWCATFGSDEALEALDRHGGIARRRRLEREIENMTAACRRALERGDAAIGVATYRAAVEVLALRGPFGAAVQLGRDVMAGLSLNPKEHGDVLSALGRVERLSGRMDDARTDWEQALTLAREAGERRIEGIVIGSLGILHVEQGRMEEALAHFESAQAIHREVGDRRWEGVFTEYLGSLHTAQGRMESGRSHFEAALAIHREVGDRRFEGIALGNLAILDREQGRLDEATHHNEMALAIHREAGDRRSEGIVLGQLANGYFDQRRWEDARACYAAALTISREVAARRLEGTLLANLAHVEGKTGRLDEARSHYEAALAIHREIGDLRFEGIALSNLGELLLQQGRLEEARDTVASAESILRRIDGRVELGKVLCYRAELERLVGNLAAARVTLEEAGAIAVEVGSGPESELARMIAGLHKVLGAG